MGSSESKNSGNTYKRKYKSASSNNKNKSNRVEYEVDQYGEKVPKFLSSAKHKLDRDYVLIVDRSGSMSGSRWTEAQAAVECLSAHICEFDKDGIDMILFDSEVIGFHNIKDPNKIDELFKKNPPRGSTCLTKALETAFEEHFSGTKGATTILVITDGSPNSKPNVKAAIEKASNSLGADEELSISFIQIGADRNAAKFLQELDDELNCTYDIVDTMSADQMKGMSFSDMIQKSIDD